MPELPDLQVFSHNLTKLFKGKQLEKIEFKVAQKLNVPEKQVKDILEGQVLNKVVRVGKELQFEFDNGHILATHLMLHGQLFQFDKNNEHKFTIVEMLFEGEKGLALTDFQKAATPTLDPEKLDTPDALDFDEQYLIQKFSATRTPVKTVLMDQKVLRGIGNAYADEILYDAKLSPFSASNKIPESKIKELAKSIKRILEDSEKYILKNNPDIISGEFRDFMLVHQPKKKETPAGETIHQKPVGSRKTYYTDVQELFS
ncbi:Fpg/Nei family DNA glycosylase [Mucilaginibacter sp. BJC16-A38]|uniref:DNA-formamidopyrimidine glycosylase family protein n=1 Tax=Mucilaginibacter phenanthrenivorans TaxID=1234842 RepID=UPI002157DB8B|nr:DNA-formamidopyrimidine glycosylase family protein [Mucilaginibacter phenanthrenivorans]MCR8560240.1 Fpg/Nei family DNA glycosylase [Mucilaginibacter phenanthrenivorans]